MSEKIPSLNQADQSLPKDILIVDDTLENLRLLSTMLTEQGYTVRKATNGQMALTAVQALPPDLILLDIMMPDMSGYEVCQKLKANPTTTTLPIIFLSALDDVLDKVKAFQIGGVDYITKPFQIEEVLVRVHNQLALKAAQRKIVQLNNELEERVKQRTQQLLSANERLRQMAIYDDLTGLFNRSEFMEQLEQSLYRTKIDSAYQFALLFLDCDRFKVVNDSLGHLVGDALLKKIAHQLQNIVSVKDTLARLGGDEFAILLSGISELNQAIETAKQIISLLKQPFYCLDYEIFINVSIGIVLINPDYQQPEHILRDADTAMYRAKDLGRGQYQVFTPTMYYAAHQLLKIETDLHRAIKQKELLVYYQPIVDLAQGKIVGFEALVRWLHPQHGLMFPDSFLPVAEETGLICSIGSLVIEQACDQLSQWQQQGFTHLNIYINLAVQQLSQSSLVEEIDRILAKTKLDSDSIKLEITESSMMQNLQSTKLLLRQLQERGIKLSIDDFGTGYSSLSQLQTFPVNTLKIDRSFIQNLDGTPDNLGLVPVILSIAHVMKLNVVAEGIETKQQLTQLRELGCHFGQGFLFAKPLNAEEATKLIAQNPHW
ncbi:response regulator receiver modulated diguanylate cyclase/phosphodiesterase [Stanieria cyanosphaera PCC 7437]|uniref:Response regulator receiver modulated diguanylate cyclase/phosphodiesterase n=1 Tax=Stanieria cyanosphaera (strain ATCC 29371 / PCC 7437) TaxID=111780 RepID=K9XVX7_STAC7|nr:GGDEF domain-containing response regulator [Stanieria cyanosphaera]AFZ36219.1 response regulator receiver modulated diguanylate cyclase/phosphodiesterase [Stanieria cyanosphaera PCC 7437]